MKKVEQYNASPGSSVHSQIRRTDELVFGQPVEGSVSRLAEEIIVTQQKL